MIAFLSRIWLFCLVTARILSEEGAISVAKKGKWVGICYSIVYGHSIATIAGWILYVVFIKQAMEFFENLTMEAVREE